MAISDAGRKAALFWREHERGPVCMTPFFDANLAEDDLATARSRHAEAWLEYAYFPAWIDATTRGFLKSAGWRTEEVGRDRVEVRFGDDLVGIARHVIGVTRTKPFWEIERDGVVHRAGCLDGLLLDLSMACRA